MCDMDVDTITLALLSTTGPAAIQPTSYRFSDKLSSFVQQELRQLASSKTSLMKQSNCQFRKVRFAPKSKCHLIQSHHDMSDAQRAALWRTPQENKECEVEVHHVVCIARQHNLGKQTDALLPTAGTLNDTHVECVRGLEHVVQPDTHRHIKARTTSLIHSVLEAQDVFWIRSMGRRSKPWRDDCALLLREISSKGSREDVKEAIQRAAGDEAYVHGLRHLEATAA